MRGSMFGVKMMLRKAKKNLYGVVLIDITILI